MIAHWYSCSWRRIFIGCSYQPEHQGDDDDEDDRADEADVVMVYAVAFHWARSFALAGPPAAHSLLARFDPDALIFRVHISPTGR